MIKITLNLIYLPSWLKTIKSPSKLKNKYNAIILTVAHAEFEDFDLDAYTDENSVVFDVKAFFPKDKSDGRL